ncbi:helix-turn-helix domain-containing protein [Halomonas saccharevitans]|uniref:DNA binding domain-containing protein, excisionase family n=1 Tax=Halomonas saccharevitans TaxID=416872 RepID=A0A1I7AYX2_9GAMM|nr:helix-turn-helix domain-containing protein [Halomonas saccharevitans]SFT80108.1 DNA binding domain-containing protein, excisionase family [Halomonas saccharevitans]
MAGALLRPDQVAERLGMSLSWVYVNKHKIGFVQFGTAVRFEQIAVERYAENCKRGPQPEERDTWESQSDTGKRGTGGWSRKRTTVTDINERLKGIERGSGRRGNTQRSAKPN